MPAAAGRVGKAHPGDPVRSAAAGGLRRTLGSLAFTQLIGWGTTFYLPAILSRPMAAAANLPEPFVFGGITLMLLVAAALAPIAGRLLERQGARALMTAGSVGMAAGLVVLAEAGGPAQFGLGWLVIGAATPFALTQASSTAIVQAESGRGARRALTILLLFTGLASTASWPALIWMQDHVGLHASLLVYALVHLLVCSPVHAFALPAGRPPAGVRAGPVAGSGEPDAAAALAPGTFWLAAMAMSCAGFLSWGLPLHVVAMLEGYGHTRDLAVAIGAVLGPAQLLARLVDMFGGHRLDILTVGVAAAALMPLAILALAFAGPSDVGAVVFCVGYGLSAGAMSIVRAVAPIRLFGPARYATMLGRLLVPQNIAFAAAPLVFATIRERAGTDALLAVALGVAILGLASFAVLRVKAGSTPPP